MTSAESFYGKNPVKNCNKKLVAKNTTIKRGKKMAERKITILGTGNAMVTKCYNTCFMIENNGEYLLVDAGGGNGILIQLKKAGLSLKKVHQMYLTHVHTDHILGAVWVVRQIAAWLGKGKYEGNFTVYGNEKVIRTIREICSLTLAEKFTCFFDNRIFFKAMEDGEKIRLLNADFQVFDIHSTKEKQFGFSMLFPDSLRLTCLGDEPYAESSELYAKGCDYLMSEAFCLFADAERYAPYEKHHSTAKDAAILAEKLGVKNLILYHTEDDHMEKRKKLYTKEAAAYYHGNIFVPEDLEIIEI